MKKIIFIILIVPSLSFSQWVNLNHYWDIPIFEGVDIVDSNTIYVSGVQQVLKTNNGGNNWFSVFNSDPSNFIRDVYFINLNTGFFIKTMGNLPYQIYKTTNAGNNWFGVFPAYWGYAMRIDMVDSLNGYATAERDVYKTTNGGNNWQLTSHHGESWWDGFGLDFINRDTGFYGVRNNVFQPQIMKTTNGGNNWLRYNLGGGFYVTGISMCNQYTGYAVSLGTIYKTTNGGFDLNEIQIWFGVGSFMLDVIAVNPDTVYISSAQGIIKTTNGGENWFTYRTSHNDAIHGIDMLNSTTGFAVGTDITSTQGAIVKTTNGGYVIGIEPNTNEIPMEYKLSQNYPNPFNPQTNIEFSLPKEGYTTLKIFDIMGGLIYTIVEQKLRAGRYSFSWDAEKFTTGVYFYRLVSGSFAGSRKMIFLK